MSLIKYYYKQLLMCLYPVTLIIIIIFLFNKELRLLIALLGLIIIIYQRYFISLFIYIPFVIFSIININTDSVSYINDRVIVSKIKESSYLVKYNNSYYYLVSDNNYLTGDIVYIDNKVNNLNTLITTYGFNSKEYNYYHNIKGVIYSNNDYLIKHNISIKGYIQRYIYNNFNNGRELINIIYLNVDDNTFIFSMFIYGFIIDIICYLLGYIFYEDSIRYIRIILLILTGICIDFNFLIFRKLLDILLNKYTIDKDIKFSYTVLLWIIFNNGYINHLGFIYPLVFKYLTLNNKNNYKYTTLISIIIQGIYTNSFNILSLLGFNSIKVFSTISFIIRILLTTNNKEYISSNINKYLIINSNPLGFGLILYIIIYYFFKKYRYGYYINILVYILFAYYGLFHPVASITFVNVGQGDAILVRSYLNKTNILIDTGKSNSYTYLDTYLKALGIKTIDTLVITHYDNDHAGNIDKLVNDYNVININDSYIDKLIVNDIELTGLNNGNSDNENDNSLVYLLSINNINFLFTADISSSVEEKIIENLSLEIDVLKASHHGSKNSSSDKFLDNIKPKIIIYSAGNYNIYNHPSDIVINKALKRHILQFNTNNDGDISFYFTKFINLFYASNNTIGIINP